MRIMFDNQALIHALNNRWSYSGTVDCVRDALNQISSKNDIVIGWIRAHVGYVGNERADDLAKADSEDRTTGCEPMYYLPKKLTSKHVHNEMEKKNGMKGGTVF